MKKLIFVLTVFMISKGVLAQVPQALNYQAIARNSMGQIIPSQQVGVRFTVLDATAVNILYQETHNSTTNNFGLFTLAIGKGTAVNGTFAGINWGAAGDKFLKVEIAPQGGTNYTIQGVTQLLSVPYALYAEKVNLVAGPGISINNNIISSTGGNGNAWLLNGNTGNTAANFLGTTDNQPLLIKTNNLQRLSISENNVVGTNNISYVTAGQQSNFSTHPVQLGVWGKDIAGSALPFGVAGSVAGMNWSPNGGSNNTLGRLMRLSQFTSTSGNNYQFYDVGIDQGGDYFIGEHQLWSDGNIAPQKIFTISPQNFVGINFAWGGSPTANFHTRGTLRFEGVNTNNTLTRVLVMDANGNVSSRDASTISGGGGGNDWNLLGNTGNTAANFLGTTDNQSLLIKTNNLQRLSISESNIVGANNISYVTAGQQSNFSTHPVQLGVWGKDISGSALPFGVAGSVAGMNWSSSGGSNNTLGRLMRLSQFTNTSGSNYQFYDVGIDQGGDYFIGEHQLWSDGSVTPRKMLTVSPQNFVGINFGWGENPTANFHTKGTVRFEGVNTNNALTRILVMDASGNVSSRDASTISGGGGGNDWSLLGNTGNTAANFLGTTDNQSLLIKTNNLQRLSISESNIVGTNNISYVTAGQQSNFSTNPVQLGVWGKDISGSALPFGVAGSVAGMNWSSSGGSNNTLGRLMRLSQFTNTSGSNYQFYDVGIDQGGNYFIGEHQLWSDGSVTPTKMFTISPQNFVGINFGWGESPTANFHTKGTVRFEGVNTNNALTRMLVMDASGNVSSRDVSTLAGFWVADANGIRNNNASGNVAIGTNSKTDTKLVVMGSGNYAAEINSTLSWQTALNLRNTTSAWRWAMVTGGSGNNAALEGVGQGNFGIANDNTISLNTTYPLIISTDDKVGIGMGPGGTSNQPRAQLHVKSGDIYIEQVTSGVIMKSPNGQCWRMTVSDTGSPVFTSIPCP